MYGGAAGAVLALRSLQRVRPTDRLAAIQVRCGDHLLKHAQRQDGRLGWPGVSSASGFGFGTAGIAYALHALHQSSGLERFALAARESLDAADTAEQQARVAVAAAPVGAATVRSHGRGAQTGWCCGTVGNALAHLGAAGDISRATDIRPGLVHDVQTVRAYGFGSDHSLCHGDVGSLLYLLDTAMTLGDRAIEAEVATRVAGLLDHVDEHGWRCGTPHGVETPGLLTGLSGIGLGLLRLARPTRVPSVLTLEPPVAAPRKQRRVHGRVKASAHRS